MDHKTETKEARSWLPPSPGAYCPSCPRSMLPPCPYLLLLSSLLLPAEGEHEPSVLYGGRLEHEVGKMVLVGMIMMRVMIIMTAKVMIIMMLKVMIISCF